MDDAVNAVLTVGDVVRAAGGVVYRRSDNGFEVAVVHRPAYDDWSLPKGKLKGPERLEAAALREVQEETGLECLIARSLGTISYVDRRGRDKVVWYWLMRPIGGEFVATEEVDALQWLHFDEALAKLSYRHDKHLLARAAVDTVKVHLVRHADAGERGTSGGPDEQRPLSKRGRKQAEALATGLDGKPLARLVASPAVRCLQTMEPLGRVRGLEIETEVRLAEGTPWQQALDLVRDLDGPSVLCSHGDVIANLVDHLVRRGLVNAKDARLEKASTWTLSVQDGEVIGAAYSPPPK